MRHAVFAGPSGGRLRTNQRELAMVSVAGEIAAPLERGLPWRIGQDGRVRALPGSGGITINQRVGDPCIGLAADHVEPGVSIRNERRTGGTDAANQALQSYACIGNLAVVTSGVARGARGIVTGKHGGIDNVLIDFPVAVMRRLAIGDRIQVWAFGLGLRLVDFPDVAIWNCSPHFLSRWPIRAENRRIFAPVTHVIPSRLMGSGLGRNNVVRGDCDIQLADPAAVRRHNLGTLRYGDVVAITDADNRYGRSAVEGWITIGVVVHSESTVAGHGPGVVSLLSAPAALIQPERRADANIAGYLNIRTPHAARPQLPLSERERRERRRAALTRQVTHEQL
jgi:hypothetical protein